MIIVILVDIFFYSYTGILLGALMTHCIYLLGGRVSHLANVC